MADVIDFASPKLRLAQRCKPRVPIEKGCFAQAGGEQTLVSLTAGRHGRRANAGSEIGASALPWDTEER